MKPVDSNYVKVEGTVYEYDGRLTEELRELELQKNAFRTIVGSLSPDSMQRVREFFRLKNVYNSNAIEGNTLSLGETQMVIREGLTITGKPLKDSLEAQNLSTAVDFFEELADRKGNPITLQDIRNIHTAILRGIDDRNAGNYRSVFVKISGSKYTPPDPAKVPLMMDEFGDWLVKILDVSAHTQHAIDPLILACAAHAWLVYIHPFIDGNGRTARLLMNLVLMRYGYPIAIITKDDRQRYYDALEESQGGGDLTPFARLVHEATLESMEIYEKAGQAQIDLQQFVASLVTTKETKIRNEYDVFDSAMRLLKGYFRQVTQMIGEQATQNFENGVGFKDFGTLEFEKYFSLREQQTAKKTWFFRLTFYSKTDERKISRYLFFFGVASRQMAQHIGDGRVSLHVATETYPFYYDRLSVLQRADLPQIYELSHNAEKDKFVYLDSVDNLHEGGADEIAREFIKQAFEKF